MVLQILNSDLGTIDSVPTRLCDFLQKYIRQTNSDEFLAKETKSFSSKDGIVYVGQREAGILSPNSSHGLKYVGSEDATTCHIVVFRQKNSGKTALVHLDDVNSNALDHVTKQVCDDKNENSENNVIEIHIFGGYEDENDTSEDLSLRLLKYLIRSEYNFHVGYCVIGSHNTGYGDEKSKKKYPRPIIYGVAVDVESGDIFPADFPDDSKGPDAELRRVRLSFRQYESYEEYHEAKNFLYQDFNNETGEITIKPFQFVQSPDLPFIAKATDKFILENMSTSPKVEPKHFCSGIRDAVRLILKHPDASQSIFSQNQPRKYLFSDNERKWIRIKS